MGKVKNKRQKSVGKKTNYSIKSANSRIHTNRVRINKSTRARSKEVSRKSFLVIRRVILTVIALAMMVVVLALLTAIFNKPEAVIKSKIEAIATDYYENYYYEKILDNTPSDMTMSEAMERYLKRGFPVVSLRQLMLFDSRRHADAEAELYKYCDPDETTIQIYPAEPFGVKDYRVEYKYACIF